MPQTRTAFDITFAYAHRLLDCAGKCGRLHGHDGRARIVLRAGASGPRDSAAAGRPGASDCAAARRALLAWVDAHIDHAVLLHPGDPLAGLLRDADQRVVAMSSNPTAENIARMLHDAARAAGLDVEKVEFWETPASMAAYGE